MTIIPVSGGAFAAYDVVVGRGLLAQAGAHIAPLAKGRTVIVTDETVAGIHAQALTASLTAAGVTSEIVAVPAGEGSKSFTELERVLDRLLEIGLDRKDVVIALGAASWAIWPDWRRPCSCAESISCRFRRLCWPRSTLPSAARRPSIRRAERTWSALPSAASGAGGYRRAGHAAGTPGEVRLGRGAEARTDLRRALLRLAGRRGLRAPRAIRRRWYGR